MGRTSSVMRFAHDSSFCGRSQGGASADAGVSPLRRRGGGRSPSGSFPIAPATPSARSLLSLGNTAQFVGSVGDAFSAICCWQIFRFTSSKPSKSAIASDEKFIRLRTNSFVRYCPCNPPPASFAQHIGQGAAVYAEVTTPSIIRSSGEGDFLQKAPLPRNLLASSPP